MAEFWHSFTPGWSGWVFMWHPTASCSPPPFTATAPPPATHPTPATAWDASSGRSGKTAPSAPSISSVTTAMRDGTKKIPTILFTRPARIRPLSRRATHSWPTS